MPRIYVNFSGLDQIGSRCKSVASKVDEINPIYNVPSDSSIGMLDMSPI